MSRHVVISKRYVLRIYTCSAILFCRGEKRDYRILSPIEKEILSCVDGKKDRKELMDFICSLYCIQEKEEKEAEYQLLSRYLEQYFELGILEYDHPADKGEQMNDSRD